MLPPPSPYRERFRAFGRVFEVVGDLHGVSGHLRDALVRVWQRAPDEAVPQRRYRVEQSAGWWTITRLGPHAGVVARAKDPALAFEIFGSDVERWMASTVAGKVVAHSGAIGWRGTALLMPAPSGAGKTTLVRALLQAGAEYIADECAVIDQRGRVWPYPRGLAILDGAAVHRVPPETFDATVADSPRPVRLVAFTEYQHASRWEPVELSRGQMAAALLSQVFNAGGRSRLSLSIAEAVARQGLGLRSPRCEAAEAAKRLLEILESCTS